MPGCNWLIRLIGRDKGMVEQLEIDLDYNLLENCYKSYKACNKLTGPRGR